MAGSELEYISSRSTSHTVHFTVLSATVVLFLNIFSVGTRWSKFKSPKKFTIYLLERCWKNEGILYLKINSPIELIVQSQVFRKVRERNESKVASWKHHSRVGSWVNCPVKFSLIHGLIFLF